MNYKIVVDAGHGGVDPGAVSNGLQEKNFNLEVALYLYNRFRELGIPVELVRSTDETVSKSERIKRILNAFGNNSNVIVLSNHINAGGGDGAEVIYALRNDDTLAKSILNEIQKEGQNIRGAYQRRLPSDPTKDYYFIHRETGNTEPLLIEYGFIDSPKDDVVQLQNNILDYAEGVVKAVSDYIGVPYVESGEIQENVYVVKKGDSLYSIANKYGVSVEDLKSVNNLSGNLLNIGQQLIIPGVEQDDNVIYVVKKGDSLWNIANDYGVSVNDIVQLNNLGTTMLFVGQQLIIPNIKENIEEETGEPSGKNIYVVQAGDTLWSIAKKLNVSVNELKEYNNLSSNLLTVGQQILIPELDEYETYIVKSGDSLWKISQSYGIPVNDIVLFNNLNNDLLSIGQVLLIPKK